MPFQQGHALLIGVGSHQYEPRLDVPITVVDAQAVAGVLCDQAFCGYPQDQVSVLHDETATTERILDSLEQLAGNMGQEDTFFFFYSGHGEYGADGNYYLVSHDARMSHRKVVTGSGVSQGELLKVMARVPARRVLMVFNACHSGEISPTLGVEDDLGAKNLPSTAASALLSTGSGRIIITACREGQYAYIGAGERTLFTQALVDGLRGKDVFARGGFISAYDLYASLYDSVSGKVQELYQREQQPELTVLKGLGSFAVALYRGATDTRLDAAEIKEEPPAGTAVNQVPAEKAQRLFQQQIGVQIGVIKDVRDSQINIAGGDVIQTVTHGDMVGRDKISVGDISGSSRIAIGRNDQSRVSYGRRGDEIERIFEPLFQALRTAPPVVQAEAIPKAENLMEEAKKGYRANDGLMATLVNSLAELAPGAVDALVRTFSNPVLAEATGPVTKMVLQALRKQG